MKKLYLISAAVLLLLSLGAHTQPYETNPGSERANYWMFGDSAGINFSQSPPNVISEGKTKNEFGSFVVESTGVICDKNGELLFYTDGKNIYNKFHSIMLGGKDIEINHIQTSSSQSNLILKHPENDSIFYIIITPYAHSHDSGMRFHVVNIKRENGLGEVISTHNILHNNSSEKVGAVFHSNGKDIWIVGHEWGNNCFFLYLLCKDGISQCPKYQCIGEPYRNLYTTPSGDMALLGKSMNQGFIKFSPNGEYMSHIYTPNFSNLPSELFSFNSLTGELQLKKNLYWLSHFAGFFMWGNSFSANSENLFLTEDMNKGLVVYNIVLDSFKIISGLNFERGTSLNLGKDGGIYINRLQDTFLGVINKANEFDSFSIDTQFINLSPSNSGYGLPNIFSSYYYTPSINFTVKLNCVLNTVQLYGQDTFQANNHSWEISKQGTVTIAESLKAPIIEFEDTGVYTVRYIASNGIRSDTVSKEILILPKIDKHFLGNDTGWCEQIDASIALKAPDNMHCYEWSNGSTGATITADTSGIYWAKIVTPNFCVIYDTVKITLDTVPTDPYIYRDSDTLKTDVIADRYQWLKDGSPTGTNSPRLYLKDTGVYSLKIISNGGCYAISDTIHIPDTSTNSINIVDFNNFKVYPNPFNDNIIVSDLNGLVFNIIVYTTKGQKLYEGNSRVIDTSLWNEGVYLIEITLHNGQTVTHKLLKQNN